MDGGMREYNSCVGMVDTRHWNFPHRYDIGLVRRTLSLETSAFMGTTKKGMGSQREFYRKGGTSVP